MKTLNDLSEATGLEVHDHLARELDIPIHAGIQAQGDLLVIPAEILALRVRITEGVRIPVPPSGVELLRGAAGGNPHMLVADPGTCFWSTGIIDSDGLALGWLGATEPVYLLHPEHGASGIAPGSYIIRRQREQAEVARLVAD